MIYESPLSRVTFAPALSKSAAPPSRWLHPLFAVDHSVFYPHSVAASASTTHEGTATAPACIGDILSGLETVRGLRRRMCGVFPALQGDGIWCRREPLVTYHER